MVNGEWLMGNGEWGMVGRGLKLVFRNAEAEP